MWWVAVDLGEHFEVGVDLGDLGEGFKYFMFWVIWVNT